MTSGNACWQSGAQFSFSSDMVAMSARGTWKSGAKVCMEADVTATMGGGTMFSFTTSGGKLVLNASTGDVICPGGAKANIGPQFGGCAALNALIQVSGMSKCVDGKCP